MITAFTVVWRALLLAGTMHMFTTNAQDTHFVSKHIPRSAAHCLHLPGDAGWPSDRQWKTLNASVGGRLIAGKPAAEVCYGAGADNTACAALRASWTDDETYFNDPVAVMSPMYLNDSCTPFVGSANSTNSALCTLGNLPSYAISVRDAGDVVLGLRFANNKKVRLVVKNTGHDFLGRSAGKGALSLWTHNLKSIDFLNHTSGSYTGPAVRLGAGVQAFEAYAAVAERGFRVTGGLCPTVGVAGGYVTGAGHGPLMGRYGLAADNTLEFEVVTPEGGHMIASPTQNADLFWALNGGGGSAFAVILSQTTRVYADGPTVGTTLTFNKTDDESFWAAIDAWHDFLPALNSVPGFACTFGVWEAMAEMLIKIPDGTTTELDEALRPFLSRLDALKIPYDNVVVSKPTYYELFIASEASPPLSNFPTNDMTGGRIIPLSTVEEADQRKKLVDAMRSMLETKTANTTFMVSGNAANLSVSHTGLENAVLPAWRDMAYTFQLNAYPDPAAPVEVLSQLSQNILDAQDVLRDLAPGSGTYLNEATYDPVHWKEDFYGVNYVKLLAVKHRYDPNGLFYGPGVVGSDEWDVAPNGRLCRAR
ncbi:FAD binding domain-containing protein [Astrocystis sublimbata]|nr:FAD binding domain-containing protein [Astrocystis sublimbata]